MKVMFISDIHGSYTWAKRAIETYQEEKADKLIILGDILYHGPRNDLPDGYNCKRVIALLNPLKKDIIAVRGNCDSEVDQMVLDFPMRSDYALYDVDGHHFFLTHGHLYNEDQLPLLNDNDMEEHCYVRPENRELTESGSRFYKFRKGKVGESRCGL